MTKKAVTVEEMKEAVMLVYKECNGNLPLQFIIRNTIEEMYNAKTIEQNPMLKTFQGAYFPRDGRVAFVCSRIIPESGSIGQSESRDKQSVNGNGRESSFDAAVKVVRHEVLGHYALNTCSAEQKKTILDAIVKHKDEPSLKMAWGHVERDYSNNTVMQKAEEVFSFVAENKPALDVNFNISTEPFTLKKIEQIAARIAEGIRIGERSQQIFPESNQAQFYQSASSNTRLSTNYQWSKSDAKMIVSINDQSPNTIDVKTLSNIINNDKFLSCYSLKDVQSGKLDLSVADGIQPIPRVYNSQGTPEIKQENHHALTLK